MRKPIAYIVFMIFEFLRPSHAKSPKSVIYAQIAAKMSKIAGKENPWTWRYVESVQAGTVAAGFLFSESACILLERLNGQPTRLYTRSQSVRVRALPGTVEPGVWVLARSKPCAHPDCLIYFVPVVPWQRYCPRHDRRS